MASEENEFDANSSDDTEKEMRRVYRKLKGVRCQISMKLRKLKNEARESRHAVNDAELHTLTDSEKEELADEQLFGRQEEIERRELGATQSEVKTLLDHKTRLRKRFHKLQEELVKRS